MVSEKSVANSCDQLYFKNPGAFVTTVGYYDQNAVKYDQDTARTSDLLLKMIQKFLSQLKDGDKILEIGSGSGRDASYFKALGYLVTATEPSKKLADIAALKIQQEVLNLSAQEIDFKNAFDGVFINTVLMHIPIADLPLVFTKIRDALKLGGVIAASLIVGLGKANVAEILEDGRYFSRIDEQTLRSIISQIGGLEVIEEISGVQENDYHKEGAPAGLKFLNLYIRKTQ